MWTNEQSIETVASPEAIWRLWSDVAGWSEWIADIEHIEISGPFAAGRPISATSWCAPSTASSGSKATATGSSTGWRSAVRQPIAWAPTWVLRSAAISRRPSPRSSSTPSADGTPPQPEPGVPALARHAALAASRGRGPSPPRSDPRAVRPARLHLVAERTGGVSDPGSPGSAGRHRHQDDLPGSPQPGEEGPRRPRGGPGRHPRETTAGHTTRGAARSPGDRCRRARRRRVLLRAVAGGRSRLSGPPRQPSRAEHDRLGDATGGGKTDEDTRDPGHDGCDSPATPRRTKRALLRAAREAPVRGRR